MTVRDIFNFLNKKFPVETACDFDNPGILTGNPDDTVKASLIALDCTDEVIEKAISNSCNLIITHHPVIFEPLKNVPSDSIVYRLIKNGISVISMHTNLDIGEGGVNDLLCAALSLCKIEKVTASDGFLLNTGVFSPPQSADELANRLKSRLGGVVKYVGCDKKISRVLVCSGSGGSYIYEVKKNNCDALITADVKHNVFLDAKHLGIALFDAGHFNTEDVVIEPLKDLLSLTFSDINFITDHISAIKSVI